MSKTVIVTGASKGLGYAIASALLASPLEHNVIVVARTEAPLRQLESRFSAARVAVVVADLSDGSQEVRLLLFRTSPMW